MILIPKKYISLSCVLKIILNLDFNFLVIGQIQSLQVFPVGGTLVMSWIPPLNTESCNLIYEVEVLNNDVLVIREETTNLYFTMSFNIFPCVITTITITARSSIAVGVPLVQEYATRKCQNCVFSSKFLMLSIM